MSYVHGLIDSMVFLLLSRSLIHQELHLERRHDPFFDRKESSIISGALGDHCVRRTFKISQARSTMSPNALCHKVYESPYIVLS